MTKKQNKIRFTRLGLAIFLGLFSTLAVFVAPATANASQITARTLTLGSSAASAVTTYTFTFTVPSATVIQSAAFLMCTTASGTCTTPSGFANSSSTLPSQPVNLGDASGWTVNTSTAGSLRLSNSGDVAAPTGSQTVTFGVVTNPSAANSSFYARMTTYSDASWTTAIDSGVTASSTAGQITVTASVDESLTFTLTAATVALGTLTTGTSGTGTSTMSAATNAGSGYSVTVNGTTLTSGVNTITALASQTASSQGTSQFGINLVANTSPATFGAAVSGAGSGTATSNYGTTNQYRFVTGDSVASAAGATNTNTFTVSYLANIGATTKPGSYSTVLTYIASATF